MRPLYQASTLLIVHEFSHGVACQILIRGQLRITLPYPLWHQQNLIITNTEYKRLSVVFSSGFIGTAQCGPYATLVWYLPMAESMIKPLVPS